MFERLFWWRWESEKAGLKLNIEKKRKIMTFCSNTSRQINGETVTDFIFLASKITANNDCSHKIKRHLLLERIAMTNIDSTLKSWFITLLIKLCIIKAMIFIVVMYRHESWTIKKAEYWRIDASELWCWRSLLRGLGLQGDPTSPSERKYVLNILWKD